MSRHGDVREGKLAARCVPSSMAAWVFAEHGSPQDVLRRREVPVPAPGPDQLLVAVDAAAVNFADGLVVRGAYQASPRLPAVAGMEIAGRVVAVGSGVRMPLGARVAGLCAGLSGAFAEYAVLDTCDALTPPTGFSWVEAACFTSAYQTAWFAVRVRGRLRPADVVLVHAAAGGVGTASAQLAKASGAHVIGVIGSQEKVAAALAAGCDHVFLRGSPDLVAEVKEAAGGGVDLVVDPVGGSSHVVSERVIRFEGRIVMVGFASGQLPTVRPDLLMVKNYSIVGLHWGLYRSRRPDLAASEYAALLRTVDEHRIKPPVSEVLPFSRVPEALTVVSAGRSMGRVGVVTAAPQAASDRFGKSEVGS